MADNETNIRRIKYDIKEHFRKRFFDFHNKH